MNGMRILVLDHIITLLVQMEIQEYPIQMEKLILKMGTLYRNTMGVVRWILWLQKILVCMITNLKKSWLIMKKISFICFLKIYPKMHVN